MSTATLSDAEETSRDCGAMGDDEGLGALNENGDDVNVSHSAKGLIRGLIRNRADISTRL
jgi:hypothetical protein